MANLTITIDEALLRRARVRAAERGTSVNAVLRQYLESWAGESDQERAQRLEAVRSLLRRARRSGASSLGRKVTRDELHER